MKLSSSQISSTKHQSLVHSGSWRMELLIHQKSTNHLMLSGANHFADEQILYNQWTKA